MGADQLASRLLGDEFPMDARAQSIALTLPCLNLSGENFSLTNTARTNETPPEFDSFGDGSGTSRLYFSYGTNFNRSAILLDAR